MRFIKVALSKLSVCECGYGVLADEIQLETKYTVDLRSFALATYRCGKCGKRKEVQVILASQQLHPERAMAYLPAELFDLRVQSHANSFLPVPAGIQASNQEGKP